MAYEEENNNLSRLSSDGNYDVKIYQIDLNHHKLKEEFSTHDKINRIINNHRESVGKELINIAPVKIDDVYYYSYLYKEKQYESYWGSFLPKDLQKDLDFKIDKLSFVLFAKVGNNVFAIVGGGGSHVIKTYQNQRFGIEFFERITEENKEDVLSITSRGISGTLTQINSIYREGQRLSDTIDFSYIPTNIVMVLSEYLKDNFFNFLDLDNVNINLEVGSSFYIKHKVSFKELHLLFKRMDAICQDFGRNHLSSFIQIVDKNLIDREFPMALMVRLRDVMVYEFGVYQGVRDNFDIDFIHPSKIQEFYEADKYIIKYKEESNKEGVEVLDRNKLYVQGLKYVYNSLGVNASQEDFNSLMWKLQIVCLKGRRLFNAPFFKYVTCEIKYKNRPVFQIDSNWYQVKDDFKERINVLASQQIEENYLNSNFLNKIWEDDISEGTYNLKYDGLDNYWVFDKCLGDKIELCDIMYETNDKVYFVHVKSGFDAKMRDLTNQVLISAKRFKNSRDSGDMNFVNQVLEQYNKGNFINIIQDNKKFIENLFSKEIVYVLAFKPTSKKFKSIRGNIDKINSNIAKFSLIQCIREMKASSYQIEVVEIKNE